MRSRRPVVLLALLASACSATAADGRRPGGRPITISVIGTADLHGHIEALPVFSGYLANLRRARAGIVLVDAGDLMQGTLESGLGEGAAVVRAYGALGYQAAAIGNHEFDFGPVGEAATPRSPADDPQGALKARAREARFPFLAANILDKRTHAPIAWDNVRPSVLVDVAGVTVGIVGVSTEATPRTTFGVNFSGLEMAPLASTIAAAAAALRAQGASVIVVAAHAGGECKKLDAPKDLSSCDAESEIFQVARALPPGAVDVIIAGHTHKAIAQEVAGIAIVQSWANGQAFGRVDLTIGADRHVTSRTIRPPRELCATRHAASCDPGAYEGAPVVADEAIAKLLAPDVERARALREDQLGVTVTAAVPRSYEAESPLGNLAADLMRAARPGIDVAVTNGGGLRADLAPGQLTYGDLYRAFPFDNRFAVLKMSGADLATIIGRNLRGDAGILSISGARAKARCKDGTLQVTLARDDGRPIAPGDPLVVLTSDFLATGGDGFVAGVKLPENALASENGALIRDALAELLRARGGTLSGADRTVFDPARKRLDFDGNRPVTCP